MPDMTVVTIVALWLGASLVFVAFALAASITARRADSDADDLASAAAVAPARAAAPAVRQPVSRWMT
jgi:hypothetical protein